MLINWFEATMKPTKARLATISFADEVSRRGAFKSVDRQYHKARFDRLATDRFQIVSLKDKHQGDHWPLITYELRTERDLGQSMIGMSAAEHLARRGFAITTGRTGDIFALQPIPNVSHPDVALSHGIAFRIYQPLREGPFGMVARWRVRAYFKASLAEEHLQRLAVGKACILRGGTTETGVPEEFASRQNRIVGRVMAVKRGTAELTTRTGATVEIPLGFLYLEASPAVLRDYETAFNARTRARSAIREFQVYSMSLTPEGKKNPNALADKMRMIRTLIAPDGASQVVFPLLAVPDATVSLSSVPAEVTPGGIL